MRITRLRLTGFKSFVEPAELLIEPGLTGVVGPNGCGKSNLLEAIRWVMGEASPKSLRGGGMEDVIFAGTAARPAREFAEVTISTDGDEGEHEVVRRVERGAGSAYRINGRDVRARDVALLFADAATGAHSPALVSQGRIAAVIAAKPAERREMLEEAAGIAGLHVRRREAELKLRATDANLARLDELLGEMEARGNALRRQARAAERYRALSADIRVAEARSLFARWRAAAADAEAARAAAERAERAVVDGAEAQRAAAAHATQAAARAAEARIDADSAREVVAAERRRLDALGLERQALERRLAELAQAGAMLARDREREDRLAIDAAEAIKTLDAEDKALGKALAAAERERGLHDAALIEAERHVRDAEVAVAQAHARAAAEAAEVRVAQSALAAARQLASRAEGEAARLARELAGLGERAPLAAALTEATTARVAAEAALAEATARSAEAEQARDHAAAARETAERAAGIAGAALARAESEAAALDKELARSAGQSVLARLRVDPGYERALAAALGDDLDAPLGGTGPRGWAGAAAAAGDPALPGGAAALAAYVRGGELLARRLAQVAVVEEDGGQPLAVGQRLVTRDGRLRRWDGYVARDLGAAAAERLVRANRLDALREELARLRAAAAEARDALALANEAQAVARRAIDEARATLAHAEQALRERRRGEDSAGGALDRQVAALAALDGRRARTEAELAEARDSLATAESDAAALPDGAASRALAEQAATAAEAARARHGEARGSAASLADAIGRDARRQQAARGEARGWRARAGDAARRIDEMDRRVTEVARERAALDERLPSLALEIEAATTAARAADAALTGARGAEDQAVAALRQAEALAAQAGEALATVREARAGSAARAEHQESRRIELSRLAGERFDCSAPLLAERVGFDAAALDVAEVEAARHDRLAAERERLGPVNLVAEGALAELDATRIAAAAEREELGQAVNRLRGSIGSLNREGRQRLTAAFEAVDRHFRRLFTTLFAGGEAHLALIDSDDPLEAGLEIMAQPPGKKLGSLTLLSGGEQALTAIALIFALFLTNPAPICVLDEVDAPLDDANIERFCDLLAAMTRETDTRYLIVTHNAVTMSRMHRLFGVTMIERGVSRLVSVDLGGAEDLLAAE